ncbi:MAG: response regulator [Pyrinomonadaceae bacterium]
MRVDNRPIVMVADYSKDTREMLSFWLKAEGCRVVEASNGQEAIELTRVGCPDLILMSLRMPLRDGMDAARSIREHVMECDVPIIAMSSYPTQEVEASALAAGCSSFIAQPFDFNCLRNLLGSLLPESSRPLSQRRLELN